MSKSAIYLQQLHRYQEHEVRSRMFIPIQCSTTQKLMTSDLLGCTIGSFPCKYLGLPLSIRKLTTPQFQYLVDQLASKLPTWRGASPLKSGRLLLVQSVLCAIPIHALMALNFHRRQSRPWRKSVMASGVRREMHTTATVQ